MRCLTVFSFICNVITCLLLCTATGTDRWKEHLDVYKSARKYIGLWRACYLVEEGNYAKLPPYYECDKDFLRPHLIEPPDWFVAIRVLMIVSCILSFFGLCIMCVALATDKHKKRGSKVSPASLFTLTGGICALIACTLFTTHEAWNIRFDFDGSGRYFANYWWIEPQNSMVNGVFFNIELWYRWSYGMGWGGAGMSVFTFIVAVLSDLTRNIAARANNYDDNALMLNMYS